VRGERTSIPPLLASPPSGGEEYEETHASYRLVQS
jgi:hypothetical protein